MAAKKALIPGIESFAGVDIGPAAIGHGTILNWKQN
jgi:hypothetical protein